MILLQYIALGQNWYEISRSVRLFTTSMNLETKYSKCIKNKKSLFQDAFVELEL